MKKITSLFKRDYEGTQQVINEVVPGAEWVLAGEGIPTEKIDGTCCMVKDGQLYKRYDHKPDNWKSLQRAIKYGGIIPEPVFSKPPTNFEPAQDPDPITYHWPGWLLVGDGPEDKWHREAIAPDSPVNCGLLDGTYELCGPKIQANPYELTKHGLYLHGSVELMDNPRTFEDIKNWLSSHPGVEGIVWHHSDGRKVKIKRRDFGFKWP